MERYAAGDDTAFATVYDSLAGRLYGYLRRRVPDPSARDDLLTLPFGSAMLAPWPGRAGFRCLRLSLAMAAPLLVAFVVMRRRSDPVHPGTAGAVLGITAGIAAGTFVDLWCPVAHLPHLLLGHILPLVVVTLVGAWVGRRLLPP